MRQVQRSAMRSATVVVVAVIAVLAVPAPAWAHEDQVIRFGSFLGGLLHPVLGPDHFLAMVSVGIVSSLVGGRAIWTVPGIFVAMMAVGGAAGTADPGITSAVVEAGIAVSVIALGLVIAADRSLPAPAVAVAVLFFGFFHGYAHGMETPDVASPAVYAGGFVVGTAAIHLIGVVIGEVVKRYAAGRRVMRVGGGVFALIGVLFLTGLA